MAEPRDILTEHAQRIQLVSDRLRSQEMAGAVLQQKSDDHRQRLDRIEVRLDVLRDDCEDKIAEARKYAFALVREYRDEQLAFRTTEREEERETRNRFLVVLGLVITVVVGFATALAQVIFK